jgi:hypothetical protein
MTGVEVGLRRALVLGAVGVCGLLAGGCGASAGGQTSSASGQSVVVRDELSLERAITGEADANIRNYFKGKLRFAVDTQCNPTTPDDLDWTCSTTIQNSIAGTSMCTIRTSVTSAGNNFQWTGPVPFAVGLDEGCGLLHSELPINLPVRQSAP